jgi:glycosyltransferase involved in cell wall biosynthesis
MRIQMVDPPAYTPPYDRALCAALARTGAEVELITTRFPYGPVPGADGYEVSELFYPRAARLAPEARGRRALRMVEHLPGMLRLRRRAGRADLVHLQWLAAPALDRLLLPARPRVLTVHDPPPAAGAPLAAQRALFERMDALIAHSEAGAERLRGLVADPARVHRIPHGVFEHLGHQSGERPLPPELAAVEGPVVLCFGLVRPYKGTDVLLKAFREVEGAELWIVGMPRMALDPLERLAARCRATVRFVPRFITDPEIPAYFRRAEIVVLPYREIEQSGVLYTALAFARPIVATDVGGFGEVARETGALRLVPPADPEALAGALTDLLRDAAAREELARAGTAAAGGIYSWDAVAERTLAVYRTLVRG